MATLQTAVQDNARGNLDLVNLVYTEATWKELLIGLVDKNRLDPWDIDIVGLVDKYVDTVKKMKVIDLRVPANIILAAAILLRLKSSILSLDGQQEEQAEDARIERPIVTIEGLNFRLRVPPKRRVSLKELIDALEDAIKIKEQRIASLGEPIPIPINIEEIDIEIEVGNVYEIIKRNMDKSRMVTFSHLSSLKEFNDILLELFVPLLFLEHDGKISLMQEKFFEDIIIALPKAS